VRRRRRLRFQNRVLLLVLVTVAPAWLATALLLWRWDASAALRWTIFGFVTLCVLVGAAVVRARVVTPLQSLANMLEALREGDYSLRGRRVDP
jgi:two-component system, NtrC family, nitrogen regulation sensor histidine kinase NtrY